MDRRQFLRLTGAGAALTLAGCGGSPDDGSGGSGPNGGSGGSTTAAGDLVTPRNAVPDLAHPSATDLAAQPTIGEFTGAVIVAFEDPSCPTCRRFHEAVYPKLYSKLIATREVAYVFRNYPVIYPWGEPASKALEATFERETAAGWALIDHYFDKQGSFDTGNVLEQTAAFLDDRTDVDGTAVADAVANGEADAAVQADLDAGTQGGMGRTTPTFALFRDDEYKTKVSGSVSYNTIATVLGV